MKFRSVMILGILSVALVGILAVAGCGEKAEPVTSPGPGERAGAALDKAVEKSGVALKKFEGKAGEAIENVGNSIEKAGADMQIETSTPKKP
jgi:hypothetical protein